MLCKCKNYIGTAFVHRNYDFLSTTGFQLFYYMFPLCKILLKHYSYHVFGSSHSTLSIYYVKFKNYIVTAMVS